MKNQFMKFSLVAFLALFAVACSSDDSSGTPSASDGEFVAKIDGSEFRVSTQVGATLYNGTFNITAMKTSTGETITISVANAAAEGTFNLGPNSNSQSAAIYMISGQDAYGSAGEGGSGTLKITNLDSENNKVSGTFSFTAIRQSFNNSGEIVTETVEVTNGSFTNIALATTLPGGGGNSTLAAKIDGTDLNPTSVRVLRITAQGSPKISIIANKNSTHQHLSLTFPESITPGTYNFTGGFSDYIGFYNPNLGGGTNNYVAESGTLKITSYNPSEGIIKGTFNFTAKRLDPNDPEVSYEITSGSFTGEIE